MDNNQEIGYGNLTLTIMGAVGSFYHFVIRHATLTDAQVALGLFATGVAIVAGYYTIKDRRLSIREREMNIEKLTKKKH